MAKIGLVTVLFKSDDVLDGFLKSLSNQNYVDYKLYLVDNTPSEKTDKCLSTLFKQYPQINYAHIKSTDNFGIAKGNNIGIEAALKDKSEYVLLSNNDIEFEQTSLLKELVDIADIRNEALLIPKIYFYDTRKIWMAGGRFVWWKAMSQHIGEWKDDNPIYDKEAYFDYAPTCFMLVHTSVFKKIGMMDEKYFVYFDDTDFAYRAAKNGFKIFYYPKLTILHKVGSSTGGYDAPFGVYYGNRNRIYFIRKHLGLLKKMVALCFVLSSRLIKYINYNKLQRKELRRAINDGFAMKIFEK